MLNANPHDEDMKLWKGHIEYGSKWTLIGTKVFYCTRSELQVKNRWYSAAFKKFVANEIGADAYENAHKYHENYLGQKMQSLPPLNPTMDSTKDQS